MTLSIFDLFDESFYLAHNPDVATAVARKELTSGFDHFKRFGEREGRDPSAWFSNSNYLTQYPDVAGAIARGSVGSGLAHFLSHGQFEGRSPLALFNTQHYLSKYADIAQAVKAGMFSSGFEHFFRYGHGEGRSPSSQFDNNYYLLRYPDVAQAVAAGMFRDGFEHFLAFGQEEKRMGAPPSFQIQFDYRFDTNGFFANPERRATLEAAADHWEAVIQDEFANLPSGVKFRVQNPQTGQLETVVLDTESDDLLIFVGAQTLPFGSAEGALAAGGPDGLDIAGSIFSNRYTGSNFEPWVGSISFSSAPTFSNGAPAPWFFDQTPNTANDIPWNQTDFLSTALHEIGHVLGIGTAPVFKATGQGAAFSGPNARDVNGGLPIPLDPDLGHIQDGFLSGGQPVLMGATNPGVRQTITRLDAAMLADIGYQVAGFQTQGFTPAIATPGADLVFGTVLADTLDGLEGNDRIQGDAGNDFLSGGSGDDILFGQADHDTLVGQTGNDQLVGGAGDDFLLGELGNDTLFGGAGRDVFRFGAANGADVIGDFVAAADTLQIAVGLGFTTGSDVLRAISSSGNTATGELFSIIALSPGNTVTVFHDAPLTAQNVVIA
ncbi:hypothetical protein NDA01_10630 [Trichocoleus desertorum AS-A10]|uniref:hypothetical protein n=1 Tax=Trichocoleus desertorum TaxID=1481672 RepID=UPI00329793C3